MTSARDLDLVALERLSSQLSATLETIEDFQWTMATPCAGWSLSDLVDHITGGNWFTSQIFAGQSADDAMSRTIAMFDGASVTSEQAVSALSDQLAAFGQPGVLDRTHHHVAGDLTGRVVLRLRLHDLIVHSWDIDQTLAPPASIPTDLVRWGLDELADDDSVTAKHFGLAATATSDTTEAAYLHRFGR